MKNNISVLFVCVLIINSLAGLFYGLNRPMESDAKLFLQIAGSVAAGDGYTLREGFWPDQPTMSRAPGWPVMIAGVLSAVKAIGFKGCSDDALMRILCLLLNSINTLLVYALALKLGMKQRTATAACGLYVFYPTALYHAVSGASEILFITLCLSGLLIALKKDWWLLLSGGLLGAAAMVRLNFVILPVALIAGYSVMASHLHFNTRKCIIWMLAGFLFSAPALLWSFRNYSVCSEFPVLSSLKGQTFYGGNNDVVASFGGNWGYWVFPDSIPGEAPMRELSRKMTEREVDRYYMEKGREHVKRNLIRMPLHCAGKLIRAYIPLPWKWTKGLIILNLYRLSLYVLVTASLWNNWKKLTASYQLFAGGMLLVNTITVLAFWGSSRFTFGIEPIFLPLAAIGLENAIEALKPWKK